MKRLLVGGFAALLVTASCSDDPSLYLNGPAGPTVAIQLSSSLVVPAVGSSVTVAAAAVDAAGNITGDVPSFSSCGADVTATSGTAEGQYTASVAIAPLTLSTSCVNVTAGSATATIVVHGAPATMRITGPDTVLSGTSGTYGIEYLSTSGAVLAPGADFEQPYIVGFDAARLSLDTTGVAAADGVGAVPGAVVLHAVLGREGGNVTTERAVTIIPGVYTGTASATTAAVQGGIVIQRGGKVWDGDEEVQLGGLQADNWNGDIAGPAYLTADSLVFYVPTALAAGSYTLTVVNQGPTQIAEAFATPFVVTGAPAQNRQGFPGNFTPGASIEDKPLPLYFPVVHPDPAVTSTTYYTISPTGDDFIFTIVLNILDPGQQDVDIQFIDGGFTAFLGDRSGETLEDPEATVWGVADGDFNFLRVQNFESFATTSRVTIFEGCVDRYPDGSRVVNGDGDRVDRTDNWDDWC